MLQDRVACLRRFHLHGRRGHGRGRHVRTCSSCSSMRRPEKRLATLCAAATLSRLCACERAAVMVAGSFTALATNDCAAPALPCAPQATRHPD